MNNEPLKILIVDDSDLTRTSLLDLFSKYTCTVYTSIDGLDGIQKAINHKPDLILLDILMPNLDGIKSLQVIKIINEIKNIPIIVISGNSNRSNMFACLESGADKVLTKPIDEHKLISAIEELTGRKLEPFQTSSKELIETDYGELKKIYLKAFPKKEEQIVQAISLKDKDTLATIFHELKGVSASMGFPEITEISKEIELAVNSQTIDWNFIRYQADEIISIIERNSFSLNLE
jgi:CheY-like chemotaxis protein/HPt (histidine-containing phosphotransfer) domain-containing protein